MHALEAIQLPSLMNLNITHPLQTGSMLFGFGLMLSTVASALTAGAQTSSTATDETIQLDTFVISAERTYGYRAANSTTATRVARPIIDTPISISVVTADFLQDTNALDRIDSVYGYVAGLSGDPRTNNTNQGIFGSDMGTMRGFPISKILRDGLDRGGNYSLRDVERVEMLKGPVSVFYGSAQPGGTINYVTKKPRFDERAGEFEVRYGGFPSKWASDVQSNQGTEASVSYNLPINKIAAFRIYAFENHWDGWHDREYARMQGVRPAALFRPLPKMELLVQYDYLRSDSNPAAQAPTGNPAFYRDYANPPTDVLAANNLTADQYRAKILSSNTNWVNLGRITYGTTKAAADQHALYRMTGIGYWILPHDNPFAQPAFSFQGAGNYVDNVNHTINVDWSYSPTDWLTLRYAFGFDYAHRDFLNTSSTVPNADARTIFIGTGGWASYEDFRRHQVNLLFKKRIGPVNNTLLVNYDYNDDDFKNHDHAYNYSKVGYQTVSANGTVLSGAQVYTNFDVYLAPIVPDLGRIAQGFGPWQSNRTWLNGRAVYYYGEINLFGHRLMPAAGYRKETKKVSSIFTDRSKSTTTTSGPSENYGVTVEIIPKLNAFASYSTNYVPNTGAVTVGGVGVNRDVNGNIVPGLEERKPLDDQTGKGLDAGIKFELLNNRLSGSFGWYRVERTHILVQDQDKTLNDPRNVPGRYYPNAAGVPTLVSVGGFMPVQFFNTTGRERNEGLELELNWSVTNNYNVTLALSNIYTSKVVSNSSLQGAEKDILMHRRLGKSPEYQGGLWNRYTFSTGRLKGLALGLGVRGQASTMPRYASYLDEENFNKAFLVWDGNITYKTKIGGLDTRFALSANNIFDRLYSQGTFAYGQVRKLEFSCKTFF